MAPTPSTLLRTLLAVLLLAALFGVPAAGQAAPAAQDPTPSAETTTAAGTPEPTPEAAPTEPPAGTATLTGVDSSQFPDLSAYLMVNDLNGARVGALGRPAFELWENGEPVRTLNVRETDVGAQVVFVIDANEAFKARDANGITRLDYITQALGAFASGMPRLKPGLDIVTLLAPEGVLLERADNPALLPTALERYDTNFGGAADPFPLLQRALTFALDPVPRPGMQRYIIYFSNGWNRFDIEPGLAEVATRSLGMVRVFPVFVGPIGAGNTLGSQNLQRLAEATGGQRFIFEGPESLTPLFQLLSDSGRQYELSYRSALDTTGQHQLHAQVSLPGGGPVLSNEAAFPLRIEAPQLRLEGLPPSLTRTAASHDADPATADPTELDVPLTVDFTDGHPRALRLAQLLVDGQPIITHTNTSGLVNFSWPLAAYVEAGDHTLQARAIDELGLAAESAPVVVHVSLHVPAPPPAPPLAEQVNDNLPLLGVALGGLLLAGAIALGAWWWLARRQRLAEAQAALPEEPTVRVRPVVRRVPKPTPAAGPPPPASPAALDDTEALPAIPRPAARPARPHLTLPAFRWGGRGGPSAPTSACYFEVVEAGGGGAPRHEIELAEPHLTLGRDAALADTVFHDRSVSRLHARVTVTAEGATIADQGSTSGTWVNYTPVDAEAGCPLRHGDLVNLGRVQLRFMRRDAPPLNGNGARVTPAPAAAQNSQPAANGTGTPDKAGA